MFKLHSLTHSLPNNHSKYEKHTIIEYPDPPPQPVIRFDRILKYLDIKSKGTKKYRPQTYHHKTIHCYNNDYDYDYDYDKDEYGYGSSFYDDSEYDKDELLEKSPYADACLMIKRKPLRLKI